MLYGDSHYLPLNKNRLFLQLSSAVSFLSYGSREPIFPLLLIALCLNESPSEEVKNDLKTTRI